MTGWIAAEVILLPDSARSWTEALYLGTGIAMCALGAPSRRATPASGEVSTRLA